MWSKLKEWRVDIIDLINEIKCIVKGSKYSEVLASVSTHDDIVFVSIEVKPKGGGALIAHKEILTYSQLEDKDETSKLIFENTIRAVKYQLSLINGNY